MKILKKTYYFTFAVIMAFCLLFSVEAIKAETIVYEDEETGNVYEDICETVETKYDSNVSEIKNGDSAQLESPKLEWKISAFMGLRWDAVENAQSYEYEVYKDGVLLSNDSIKSNPINTNNSLSMRSRIENGGNGTYLVKVRAVSDSYESSEWSSIEYVYTRPDTQLDTPENIHWTTPEGIKWGGEQYGTVRWNPVYEAGGYAFTLYCNDSYVYGASFSAGHAWVQGESTLAYSVAPYINEPGNYTVTIQALSEDINEIASSNISKSPELHYIVPSAKLSAPENIYWDGTILKWDAVEGADIYLTELYYNGKKVKSNSAHPSSDTSYDYAYSFEKYGEGVYVAKIRAISADISEVANSDYASSPEYCVGDHAEDNYEEVSAFVSRLYQLILNREADAGGLEAWTNQLLSKTETGAQNVAGFIESDEFTQRGLSNSEVVEIMYQAMLGRESDEAGKEAWVKILDNGCSYLYIVNGFSGSTEFNQICEKYGINAGTVDVNRFRDKNAQLTAFVARCYTQALGRTYEVDGLEAWCKVIVENTNTPKQVAQNFIFSDEFVQKNLSDEEYVKVLYRTFMGREADEDGLVAWVAVLESGKEDRAKVLEGFSDSVEFDGILQSFGLN